MVYIAETVNLAAIFAAQLIYTASPVSTEMSSFHFGLSENVIVPVFV